MSINVRKEYQTHRFLSKKSQTWKVLVFFFPCKYVLTVHVSVFPSLEDHTQVVQGILTFFSFLRILTFPKLSGLRNGSIRALLREKLSERIYYWILVSNFCPGYFIMFLQNLTF